MEESGKFQKYNKRNSKKPSLKKFTEAAEVTRGNITKIAEVFGVRRNTVHKWCNDDPDFRDIIDDYKGQLFDECLRSARAISIGIPKTEGGKIVGWVERPDSNMLKYLISVLGRKEGFGESLDITTNGRDVGNDIRVEVIDRREQVRDSSDDEDTNS